MIKLIVLSGGPSSEHDVSVNSTKNVLNSLDRKKYEVSLAFISKDEKWSFGLDFENLSEEMSQDRALEHLTRQSYDIAFIALHGTFGEDGKVQSLLDDISLKYTGSGSDASSLVMDKVASQDLIKRDGVATIETIAVSQMDWAENRESIIKNCKRLADDLIIKPNDGGSSIGITRCQQDNLEKSINQSFIYSKTILVQPFIRAREFSCGVLEFDGIPKSLPVTEIIPHKSDFFDFESKYDADKTDEITPAKLDQSLFEMIMKYSLQCHQAFGCNGYSRTDFIVKENEILFLETNTLPGLTENSILPKQAKSIGIDYSNLLDLIIEAGLK